MKLTFLGTGTSHGVPVIGCTCPVCHSTDPRDKRTRCSAILEHNGVRMLIDTPPELRLQAVREGISSVDAVLFTHGHADHLFGLDDTRRFNDAIQGALPIYANSETIYTIKQAFGYVFRSTQWGGGKPVLELNEVTDDFEISGIQITPIPVLHGNVDVLGYRVGDLAYITDCSVIPHSSMQMLYDLDTLVIGVIRHEPHSTHFCVSEALTLIEMLKPKQAYFTHISHRLEHEATDDIMPPNVKLAYDGLTLEIEDKCHNETVLPAEQL